MPGKGMSRLLDNLGRVVIPMEIRRSFNLKEGDGFEVTVEDGRIILDPVYTSRCVFCAGEDDLLPYCEKYICKDCIAKVYKGVSD